MRLVSALIAAVFCAAAIGCGLNQEGIGPPNNQIFFPGAIRVDPINPRWLYVVNSNSDLRYNDGTLVAVDLALAEKDRKNDGAWGDCPSANYIYESTSPASPPPGKEVISGYCCWDTLDRNVLNCDERNYIKSAVRIGSFGSAIEVQPTSPVVGKSRLFMGVRGNASITWTDVDLSSGTPGFDCAGGPESDGFVECDTTHRVTAEPNGEKANPAPVLPDEPYALAVDTNESHPLLYVGHLRGGFLSAVDLRQEPTLFGSFGSIFPGDINGSLGVTSLTVTATGLNTGHVLATSRFLPRAGAFIPISNGDSTVAPPNDDSSSLFLANAGDVFASPLAGAEARGIQVIPEINRTYLLQRTPPTLVGFDTLGGQNVATDVMEMCQGPTFLHMSPPYSPKTFNPDGSIATTDTGMDKLLFVTCFEAGEVYVVDPYTPQIISIIEVGRGPAGLTFGCAATPCDPAHPDRAYVVGFGANNVSVIDLKKDNPTYYHVIQRIGFPSPLPR